MEYGGEAVRGSDLFNQRGFDKVWKGIGESLKRGLKGVENIYTEHKPYLKQILEQVASLKLKETEYPFATGNALKAPYVPSTLIRI